MDKDKYRGLYTKFHVERLDDPTGKHKGCRYFVLDLNHDKFAIPALQAYIGACINEYPELAHDLVEILVKLGENSRITS